MSHLFPTTLANTGASWIDRQWIKSVPGVVITHGITQNNLIIRQGHKRPQVFVDQSTFNYFR